MVDIVVIFVIENYFVLPGNIPPQKGCSESFVGAKRDFGMRMFDSVMWEAVSLFFNAALIFDRYFYVHILVHFGLLFDKKL